MSQFLIVEDSRVDQMLLVQRIQRQWPDDKVHVCGDATAASTWLEANTVDLILCDMQLPGMSGLAFIECLKERGLSVPVVLVTGVGSEALAVEAIHAGAAGYVPKADFDQYLIDTVDRVLRLSRRHVAQRRLLGSLFHQDLRFCLENDLALVTPFVEFIQEHISAAAPLSDPDLMRIGVALSEGLCNAINHGNLELDSDLRQEDERHFYELGRRRRRETPYADRHVYVAVMISGEGVDFRIRDEGPGFDVRAALERLEQPSIDRIGGRGLLLIRSFVDTLSFNDTGNEIRFSKRVLAKSPQTAQATVCV